MNKTSSGVYVASRTAHAYLWQRCREKYPVISTWIDEAGAGQTADFAELWGRIRDEIAASRALVLYAEEADFPLKGALIEAGMAIALGKPVFLVLPHVAIEARSCRPVGSWMLHPLVKKCETLEEAFAAAG